MSEPRNFLEREKELQSMIRDPAGRDALNELAQRYHAESGKPKPARGSIITYLLVHEREHNLIKD